MSLSSLMSHSVTVRRPTTTTDEIGGISQIWADIETIACRVIPVGLRERFAYQKYGADISIAIKCEATTVRVKDQIVYGSRTFIVAGVIDEHEQDRLYTIYCTEVL